MPRTTTDSIIYNSFAARNPLLILGRLSSKTATAGVFSIDLTT
jgi:hypothetical protein